MALRLPKFQAGRPITEEVTAEKLNQIVDAIRQCELQSGVGYDVTRGPGGATLAIRRDNMIPSSQLGAAYVIGPPSTGVAQDGTLIGPGETTPAWSVRRPGSDVFEPIYVFGENNFWYEPIFISCSSYQKKRYLRLSGISLTSEDTSRFSGLMSDFQGTVYDLAQPVDCPCQEDPYPDCSEVQNPCTGVTDYIDRYFPNGPAYSAAGSYGVLEDGCFNAFGQSGTFVFRCSFDLGSISPSQVKIRFRLLTKANGPNNLTNITNIQLNSQAALYSPSGSFNSMAGFNETREISSGFVEGLNTIDFYAFHTDETLHPGIRCEFEPTTALIIAMDDGDNVSGLSDLTDEQVDLIGQGTPVKALDGNDPYIWSYSGTGDKRSSASYTRLREA